ncbi:MULTISPECIES: hypothetical protein [Haloferacaceae]|uniref:Halobacterial output domain-containing protein n=1 Tax=Halorubrum glutamatedens TaxID=2707018 RepID=A0ABD5QTU5_9EURY|nr:hypothetical protein [Halobellus captivus]
MAGLQRLNEREMDRLAAYSIGVDEETVEGIVRAFDAVGVDVSERPTQLVDWVHADTLDLRWSADWPVYLSTRIWDHRVVITAEELRIYPPLGLGYD